MLNIREQIYYINVTCSLQYLCRGADLGLLAGVSQSVVVMCYSTYEPGGGATHVSFYLRKDKY